MTARPQFKTYDEWFAWILRKLRHGSWSSKSTKFYAWEFLVGYSRYIGKAKEPVTAFLSAKVDELRSANDEPTIERLRFHVLACREITNRRTQPATAKLLKKLEGAQTAPSVRYTFKRERGYTDNTIAALPPVEQKQFLIAAAKYLGGTFRTVPTFFKKLRSDPDEADVSVERWQISVERRPIYVMWTFLVDNGTVFPIGSTKPAAGMVQGTFQGEPGKKETAALASDLQRTVPF